MDNTVDPVWTIYRLLLANHCKVIECKREGNIVKVTIAMFWSEKKMSLLYHDHYRCELQLAPDDEDSGSIWSGVIENEMRRHT